MSLARQEGPIAANGVIGSPGTVLTTFGGYARRRPVQYVRLEWLYVQAAASTPMQLVLVEALADVAEDAYMVGNFGATGSVPSGVSMFRPCQPVPLSASGVPYLLVIRNKSVNTNLNVILAWSDVED